MEASEHAAGRGATAEITYGKWRSSRIGGGGYLQEVIVAATDPERVYTYTDIGGFYRSDDGGQTWRMMHGHLPRRGGNESVSGLMVDPRDEDRVIIATGRHPNAPEGVYLTEDGGETWTRTLQATFIGNASYRATGRILDRHPTDPDTLLVGSPGDGVWRSEDNGQTWKSLGLEDHYIVHVRFDWQNPERIWVCAKRGVASRGSYEASLSGGFYRSDNAGQSWQRLAADDGPFKVVQDPTQDRRLYGIFDRSLIRLSEDGGETWRDFSDGLPIDQQAAHRNQINEHRFLAMGTGPDFVVLTAAEGTSHILKAGHDRWQAVERESVDFGDWQGAPEPGSWQRFGWAASSIVVSPHDPQHWYMSDWFAIYQSRNAGRDWTLTIDGIEVTVAHTLATHPDEPQRVHVGMADIGYLYSEDQGLSFHRGGRMPQGNNIKAIAVSPATPARVYAVGSGGDGMHSWVSNQIWLSEDRGGTWRQSAMGGLPEMGRGDGAARGNSIVADPQVNGRVYYGVSGPVQPDGGGFYVSEDGGDQWRWRGEGLPAGEAFYSGTIWLPRNEIAVGAGGAKVTFSHSARRVFYFDADADRWVESSLEPEDAPWSVVADPHREGRFFLTVLGSGLYRSNDGGRSWAKVYAGRVGRAVTVDPQQPGRVAAVGGPWGVILSFDGGDTWLELGEALPTYDGRSLSFAGDRLLFGSSGNGVFWMPMDVVQPE